MQKIDDFHGLVHRKKLRNLDLLFDQVYHSKFLLSTKTFGIFFIFRSPFLHKVFR